MVCGMSGADARLAGAAWSFGPAGARTAWVGGASGVWWGGVVWVHVLSFVWGLPSSLVVVGSGCRRGFASSKNGFRLALLVTLRTNVG